MVSMVEVMVRKVIQCVFSLQATSVDSCRSDDETGSSMCLLTSGSHCGGSEGEAGRSMCLLPSSGHYGGSDDEASSSVCLLITIGH